MCLYCVFCVCFFQAEDGIRDLVRSRGLGDVYKRQLQAHKVGLGLVVAAVFERQQLAAHTGGQVAGLALSLIHI